MSRSSPATAVTSGDASPIGPLSAYMAAAMARSLPDAVVAKSKHHVLDTVAAMVSGAHLAAGNVAIPFIRTQGGTPETHVVASRIVTSATNAAMANGMLAHADETDDHHLASITHPGCCVVPAALAVGELTRASGRDFIAAVVLGYDVTARIGEALTNRLFYEGFSMVSFGGGFGAAVAAGGLLGLDARQFRFVLSYVAQQAAGARSWQRDPDHIEKAFVLAGAPARNGVSAALMVKAGFTGVEDVFSGDFNFFAFHSPDAIPSILERRLGEEFEIMRTSIKKWCVGGPVQAPLDGLQALMREGLTREQVVRLDVRVASHHASVVDNRDNPTINLQHCLGLMLVDGTVSFAACHDMGRMDDPLVLAERAKVNLIYDKDMDKVAPRRPVDVVATLVDGTMRAHRADSVRGYFESPLSTEEVEAKAMDLMVPVLGEARSRAVCRAVAEIDSAPSLAPLIKLLAVDT